MTDELSTADAAQLDAVRNWTTSTPTATVRRPPTICRCGHRDDNQLGERPGPRPVADLRDNTDVIFTTITERPARMQPCRSCDHGVGAGDVAVVVAATGGTRDRYHLACVLTDPLHITAGDVVVVTYTNRDLTAVVTRTVVLDTHYPTDARPQARLAAPADLADGHRDPNQPDTYRVYADTIGRVTDPALIAATKGSVTA